MDFLFEEITFRLLELKSGFLKLLEDDLDVFEMLLLIPGEDDDVIKVCHCKINTVLQNYRNVESKQVPVLTQKERNCIKFLLTKGCDECSFCHGLFVQTDVVITTSANPVW